MKILTIKILLTAAAQTCIEIESTLLKLQTVVVKSQDIIMAMAGVMAAVRESTPPENETTGSTPKRCYKF